MDRMVLFDIDKTLLVGSKFHYLALKNAITEVYGVGNPKPVKNMQGMTDLKIICCILSQENMDFKTIKTGLDECMDVMYKNFKDTLEYNDLKVMDGVRQLLKHIKHLGIPMGLVTGNMENIAWLKLESVGLKEYFKFGGFGDHTLKRSILVQNAIISSETSIGSIYRDHIFLVGDTPRDMVGGVKFGVRTIGVATGDFSQDELIKAGAEFILEDLKDIDKVLKIILEG
jgi:phosphoglycolate phosphatase-like HAD superfamily hydrolase